MTQIEYNEHHATEEQDSPDHCWCGRRCEDDAELAMQACANHLADEIVEMRRQTAKTERRNAELTAALNRIRAIDPDQVRLDPIYDDRDDWDQSSLRYARAFGSAQGIIMSLGLERAA